MTETLSNRIFHGKLLLFGEHSVIDGSKALVMPYLPVSARLAFQTEQSGSHSNRESNRTLQAFAAFLAENRNLYPELTAIHVNKLMHDIDRGLYLGSTIPGKYGLGSSGAVCAAVFHEYGPAENGVPVAFNPPDLRPVRNVLAAMESHFHGRSSGIDPLCIYCDVPLIVEGKDTVVPCATERLRNPGMAVFLLDTGLTGNTGDLVKGFRNKLLEQGINESFHRQYIPLVNHLVDQFTGNVPAFDLLLQLSVFQWVLFQDMIPMNYHSVWQYGLDSEYYACKLCGSGGGGYILGFTRDFEKTCTILAERFNLTPVRLDI